MTGKSCNHLFQFINVNTGDLVFFHQFLKTVKSDFTKAIISSSLFDSNIFHVGIVVDKITLNEFYKEQQNFNTELLIVHATSDNGVIVQDLLSIIDKEQPDFIGNIIF